MASLRDRGLLLAVGVAAVLAYLVRLRLITHGAGLAASDNYDDGVYYAAADALIHGRLPYRDFLLLHPPGIAIALAPFAAIGSAVGDPTGVIVARLVFIGIGAGNTAMIGLLAARYSRAAGVIAAFASAVFFPLAYSERSTLLEPLGTALLLAGLTLLWRPRASPAVGLVAGLVAGASVDVKIWYVVPVLVLGAFAGARRGAFLLGAATSAAAIALPFFVAAPAAMVREIVLDQLGRPASRSLHAFIVRIVAIGSDPRVTGAAATRDARLIAAAVLLLVVVAAVAVWTVPWARVVVVLAAATGAVLLASPSFFLHYVAYVAPWMMLTLGIGIARMLRAIGTRSIRIVVVAAVVGAVGMASANADLRTTVAPQPAAALSAALRGQTGCVLSDDPGLLADADALSRDLAQGCPLWPDVTGWTYDRDSSIVHGSVVQRADNAKWQHDVMRYLLSGDLVVVDRAGTGLSAASRRTIASLPVAGRAGRLVVHRVGG